MVKLKRVLSVGLCLSFLQLGPISAQAANRVYREGAGDGATEATCAETLQPMVTYDPTTYAVKGFTPEGIQIIKRLRDEVRRAHKQFVRELLNMDTIFKANLAARMERQHVFIYGPHGGAKTMVTDFFLAREPGHKIFRIQMHQMRTDQSIVGGQNMSAGMSGRYEVNHETSIIKATAGNVDEIDKANPAALQPLLEILNERRVSDGLRTYNSDLNTLYVTSNSSLPEFLDNFNIINPGAGPAFLNRFVIKELSYNWLPVEDRMILQERKSLRTRLETLALSNPELKANDVFETPQDIDYGEMRRAAELMFVIPGSTEAVLKEFVNHVRRDNFTAAKTSLQEYNKDKAKVAFAYVPTLSVSTRNDLLFDEMIKASAFIDFLLSPLADDNNLSAYLARGPIELDSLSIWRSYMLLTTIAPGDTRLNLNMNENNDKIVNVDFGWKIDRQEAETARDEKLFEYLQQEQFRFSSDLQVLLTDYQSKLKQRAEMLKRLSVNRPPDGQDSFELQLSLLGQQ